MKTIKKIVIGLIISLAVFAYVEKDCFLFSGHSLCVIENTANSEKSDNSISANSDLSEVDITLVQYSYSFNLKSLSSEKVTISATCFPQNIYYCIWQPPKIS
jgi:hypothetical protein